MRDKFTKIYQYSLWGSEESASGPGSELEYTRPLRKWLIDIVPKLEVKVFLDAACGDFNWMKEVVPNLGVNYIGLDIVPALVRKNQKKYSSKNINFHIADICKDKLPKCDLIMVRDCLWHLSNEDVNHFFVNLSRLEYKYLLTSTHLVHEGFCNTNIVSGEYKDFRMIDLFSDPFNFSKENVKNRVRDCPEGAKEMILVEKQFVPKFANTRRIKNAT